LIRARALDRLPASTNLIGGEIENMAAKMTVLPSVAVDPWPVLWSSFERSLRADGASPATLRMYRESGDQAHAFLAERSMPTDPAEVRRGHVEEWLIYLREGRGVSAGTQAARFSALRRFFTWLEEEGEVEQSPMLRMKGPKVEVRPPDVLTDDESRRLLDGCRGPAFEDKRDVAILRLMLDTGLRRGEVAGVKIEDLDLAGQAVQVVGKGARPAVVFFGAKVARDLDRYLRTRARHRLADLPWLWLAQKGPLSGDGILQMLQRRAKLGGITRHLHPHLLRHTWAHQMKAAGASDEDVMTLGRWRDRNVMARYGASAALARARETHRRMSPGDRL
jgi:site-specific recombinase XerD